MLSVGFIGYGAIARFVRPALSGIDARAALIIARPGREEAARQALGGESRVAGRLGDERPDVVIDCAGHDALRQHGAEVLRAGVPLITVSVGALADAALHLALCEAARAGGTTLRLATGAIGALDALACARHGKLDEVTYIGRKPPAGWKGSAAEDVMSLDGPLDRAATHFEGTAREAALRYPKNANVAAAVALAGLGLDATRAQLIADPSIQANVHEVHARGDFGHLRFRIAGDTLPGNPRTSALAAMSVVAALSDMTSPIVFR